MRIGFIGAGKVGKALGCYFQQHGLEVCGYYSQTMDSASQAADLTKTKAFSSIEELKKDSRVIFITTTDQAISSVDQQVYDLYRTGKIKDKKIDTIWCHVSGAHTSGQLARIKELGFAVGSLHPLQSFADFKSSVEQLSNTHFTFEGTKTAQEDISQILSATGNSFSVIQPEDKPLYHAGACVVSNYLVTLVDTAMKYFEAAGMERMVIYEAIKPLIFGTLDNIEKKDTVNALTGPIVRADGNTLKVHARAMKEKLPDEKEFYKFLGIKTVEMIKNKRLSSKESQLITEILKGSMKDE